MADSISNLGITKSKEEDLINFDDSTDGVVGTDDILNEVPVNAPVTEKVIFCIDKLSIYCHREKAALPSIFHILKLYFAIKEHLSVKAVDFTCLVIDENNTFTQVQLNQKRDFHTTVNLLGSNPNCAEHEPFNFDLLFTKLAQFVDFTDSNFHSDILPPPCVYHVILLFGRNVHIPEMDSTNAFDFLMSSPYFALDILYIFDKSIKNQKCEFIAEALMRLNENKKGYFFSTNKTDAYRYTPYFMQFAGHPLIRFPQEKAKFNINELGPLEVNIDNDISDDNVEPSDVK